MEQLCNLYDVQRSVCPQKLQDGLFTVAVKNRTSNNLPPTYDALLQHLKRAIFQGG